MGVSEKTLYRLLYLGQTDQLPSGGKVLELGAQSLYCKDKLQVIQALIDFNAGRVPGLQSAEKYPVEELQKLADGGFMSELLEKCGMDYVALDIFQAPKTTIFDLNFEEPGEELRGQFDLVTNFGTTEHILNQLQALKTMHEVTKPGGLMYHDLPLGGFLQHGYFCYTPVLFEHIAKANNYTVVFQGYAKGNYVQATRTMAERGYPDPGYYDYGIETILRKTSDAPFRAPLETSTSLGLEDEVGNAYWHNPPGEAENPSNEVYHGVDLAKVPIRELLKECWWRCKGKALRGISRK